MYIVTVVHSSPLVERPELSRRFHGQYAGQGSGLHCAVANALYFTSSVYVWKNSDAFQSVCEGRGVENNRYLRTSFLGTS